MNLKSSEAFWLVKNGILHSYPSLRNDSATDILVVGGGITGSLIAHQCMEEGYKTMLIDRREIANGSTSATTAMLQYEIDVPLYQLIEKIGEQGASKSYWACYDAIDKIGKIAQQVGSDSGFKKKNSLYFAAAKNDVNWLKKEFEARKAHEFPVDWLETGEILDRFQLHNTCGGILSEQGASIDAFHFTHDLLAFNYNRGLCIYDKTAIKKVEYRHNTPIITTGYGNKITAKSIIYCNGYESTEIIKDKFVKLFSTYVIVSEACPRTLDSLKNLLVWNTATPYIYMRTTDDNRILIGGGDRPFKNIIKRDALLDQKQKKLEKELNKVFPWLDARTDFVWAGTFGQTKDGLPYIGKHPNFPSSYFVLGFGGNGITFSVVGMDMISKMLQNKEHPLTEYFRFGR